MQLANVPPVGARLRHAKEYRWPVFVEPLSHSALKVEGSGAQLWPPVMAGSDLP